MAIEDKDLEGLSEQERAALTEVSDDETTLRAIADKTGPADAGDDSEASKAAEKAALDEDDTGNNAEEGKGKADDNAEKDVSTQADSTKANPAEAVKSEPVKAPSEPLPVVFTASSPEDAAEQIAALRAEKAVAFKKLMDGEMTPEDYSAKEDEVASKITEIDRAVTKAETAVEFTNQQAKRSYVEKVNHLIDSAKNEGIDYRGNFVLHAALDATVRSLANDPENAEKPEHWFLQTAHKMVKDSFGVGKRADDKADTNAGKREGAQSRSGKAPDLSGLPPSLRNVPAAAESDDGGEFAHLSNLTGMALERAIAKMTPEQQQRWAEAD